MNEADAPYSNGPAWVPADKLAVSSNKAQVTGHFKIDGSDIEGMKQAIMDHGGIAVSIYANKKNYYNSSTNAYLTNWTGDTNHAVMIVGWDDSFAKENFSPVRPTRRDGAWLVRNSWGDQGYSFSGYFWMSYVEPSLRQSPAFAFDADIVKYDHVYAYDLIPFRDVYWEVNDEVVVSQDYTVDPNETISAVGIETGSANVYLSVSVSDGTNTATGSTATTYPGFYTVKLNNSFRVSSRKNVTVTVTYKSTDGSLIRVLAEGPDSDYYGGERYVASVSGPGMTINGYKKEYDARMKLYTTSGSSPSPAPTPTPTPTPTPSPAPAGTIAMYRMYNPNSGEHFYTGNEKERAQLVSVGWKYEGVGFYAPQKSNTPMYRLYNPNAGDHHYTYSTAERDSLVKAGWKSEGIGWYSDDAKTVKMYRLYNPNATGAGSHHYTSNNAERQNLIKIGWKDESVGFYAVK